jgi:hypothetical protein
MLTEDDLTEIHQEDLAAFYATYEDALHEYEVAKAEALSLFNELRQEILETISDATSEILIKIDQTISAIKAAYEQAKSETNSQVTEQVQVITALHAAARIAFQNLYQVTKSAVTQEHRNATAESKTKEEAVKSLVEESKADLQTKRSELFDLYSKTFNEIHAAYINEQQRQQLNYQIALAKYNISGIPIMLRETTTRKYIEAQRERLQGSAE